MGQESGMHMLYRAGPVVIHDDANLLVVDKPGNLVCHSPSRDGQPSLASWLREYGISPPRMINRLDRETSGLVLVAKNERSAKALGKQVLRREIEKEYVAVCFGVLARDTGVVDQPIALTSNSAVYTKRIVADDGKSSVTEFTVERRLPAFTVVRLKPRTGRAHQLRVHMAWLGHPIVGDKVYGTDERWYLEFIRAGVTPDMLEKLLMPRHALHAARLTLRYPPVCYEAPLPEDMKRFIEEHN